MARSRLAAALAGAAIAGCSSPDPATAQLAASISIPVIASGGVASLDDVTALVAAAAKHSGTGGIDGTIIGRALYDGRIDPAQALAAAAGDKEREAAC